MTGTSADPSPREILLSFAAEGTPTPERLEEYAKKHPEHIHELTELAVEMVLEPARQLPPADDATARIVHSAWERFRAGTRGAPSKHASEAQNGRDPFADVASPEFPRLAARLGITPAFLLKIRDRLIEAASFPNALAALVARELGRPIEAILAHLALPATIPVGTLMKSDGKPQVSPKQSFEEAVMTSGLSEAQRAELLALTGEDRGPD